jgi:hypothetical protein
LSFAEPLVHLNELLGKVGVDPATTLVMRHRPKEAMLRDRLPWYASAHPDLFNAYQRSQEEGAGRALGRSDHLVSLIGHEAKRALFVGIYRVAGSRLMNADEFYEIEANRELGRLGSRGPTPGKEHYWADLELTEHLDAWRGRMVVDWPPPERS